MSGLPRMADYVDLTFGNPDWWLLAAGCALILFGFWAYTK